MLPSPLISLILLATTAYAKNTATGTKEVAAAAATAATSSPTSFVKGKAFDRFVVVWLENTDFDKAGGDREFCLSLFFWFMLLLRLVLGWDYCDSRVSSLILGFPLCGE